MTRRHVSLLFILAMLILPQTSGALPREACIESQDPTQKPTCVGFKEDSSRSGYTTLQTFTVPSDGTFVFTTNLVQGVQYRLKVTGTWQYDSITSHRADMAFSTSDGWSSASKPADGRSLEIDGQKQSNTSVMYSSAHSYLVDRAGANGPLKLRIYDQSYTDGNTGSLNVEVQRLHRVTYVGTINAPLGLETFNLQCTTVVPTRTVTSPVQVTQPVGPFTVPAVPALVTFKGKPVGNDFCFVVHNSSTGDLPGVCLPNLFNQPAYEFPVYPVPSSEHCSNRSCDVGVTSTTVPEVAIGPMAIPDDVWKEHLSGVPGTGGERPFKPGSSIQFIIEWEADRDHLYLAASGPGGANRNGFYQPFDVTSPSEINWFLSNRDRLSARIKIAILFPDGTFGPKDGNPDPSYFPSQEGFKIPGLGQVLEASFSSRVEGR